MAEHEETGTAGCRQTLRRYLPLGLLLAAMAAVYAAGGHRHISFAALAEHREALLAFVAAHRVAALGLYMLVYVAAIALSLPGGALLTIAGGFLFGWLVAGAAVVVAATVGATIVFLVARTSLGETLSRRAGPALNRLAVGFRQDALAYLLFLRLVPVFPFWLVNLAPALLGMKLWPFVVGTLVGIVPGTFAFAFLGSGLGSVIDEQERIYRDCLASRASGAEEACVLSVDPSALLTPQLVIAFAALGVIALIPPVVRRLRARRGAGGP